MKLPELRTRISRGRLFVLILIVSVLLFFPWVFLLFSGMLIYFPYDETGKSRYIRITGPIPGYLGADWTREKDIPKACKRGLLAGEDWGFYEHIGIEPESLWSAYRTNRRYGKIITGGSTITQQLVKNAFLSRDKTYIRKLREVLGAVLLNLFMAKDTQITWYLNVVEFGPRVYGIKAASSYYFKKPPAKLNSRECATLITFLPRPVFFGTNYLKGKSTAAYQRRYARIIHNAK